MEDKNLSPRHILRTRRPEQFSDTGVTEIPILDRLILEYHLDTLTNRNEHTEFEVFARRLSEREICPNLLPQTGPTGGGDSKVDSETYPVADSLSLGWYYGLGRESASERWAFAFSAKKDWKAKVRSDISKIAGTGRGYLKAFFISNQYIPDKYRAKMEDELSGIHNLDVRILDRTWILDRVFEHGHEALAIDALNIKTSIRKDVQKGPLDTQRERELDELEVRIQTALQDQDYGFQLVDDCIEAAILSRELERTRYETEGRFIRANQISLQYGTIHQRVECAYQRAWTTFWWFEDYELFHELYNEVEVHAKAIENAYELELLTNLWYLLYGTINRGILDAKIIGYEEHTSTLISALTELSKEEYRPSNALQAKTLLLLVQISLKVTEQDQLQGLFRELEEVIRQCQGLVGYPFKPLVEIVIELGNLLNNVPGYEELFETIIEVVGSRQEEVVGARMLLKRGEQQLTAENPYKAIRLLGRALNRLYKHESRHDLVRALYLCGCAYEYIGLIWAARGTLLNAASIATNDYWKYGNITISQVACYDRLKWLELQLGRLPQILSWHEIDVATRSILNSQGYDKNEMHNNEQMFDAILGILFLKTAYRKLNKLSKLPDVLERLGLYNAQSALFYVLGYEDKISKLNEEEDDPYTFFLKWRNQPASEDLPSGALMDDDSTVILTSNILGCRIILESNNTLSCIELSESILASIESLLSTSYFEQAISREPVFNIVVKLDELTDKPFSFELEDLEGIPYLKVLCGSFNPNKLSVKEQEDIKNLLFELLAKVFSRLIICPNFEKTMDTLFRDELAYERSINFTGSLITLGNIMGHDPKTNIADWYDPKLTDYPVIRSDAWDIDIINEAKESDSGTSSQELTYGVGEVPKEIFIESRVNHKKLVTVSLIRESLWDKAGWCGTAFLTVPGYFPVIAPIFRNSEVAKEIFNAWLKELGEYDENERLRVAIIRGIDLHHPHSYRVLIGSNLDVELAANRAIYAFIINRTCTMEPETDINLTRFVESYEKSGKYLFAPAAMPFGSSEPDFYWDLGIKKRLLKIRQAWEIGRHDPDCAGIMPTDNPIIPLLVSKPPVLELLQWKRNP